MDKFVKEEMWKMPAKKRIQIRIVSASAVKRELDLLSVCPPPTHLKMFRQKRNSHKLLRSNHPYYRNVSKHLWREPQIITFENAFHIWINIGYICERTLSAMPRVTLPCASYRLQLTIATSLCSFRAEFHKIGSWPHQLFYYSWVELFIKINVIVSI